MKLKAASKPLENKSPLEEFIKGTIGKTAFTLWIFLRSVCDDTGCAWGYSTKDLTTTLHTCPRTLYVAVNELKSLGVLEVFDTTFSEEVAVFGNDIAKHDGNRYTIISGDELATNARTANMYKLIGG